MQKKKQKNGKAKIKSKSKRTHKSKIGCQPRDCVVFELQSRRRYAVGPMPRLPAERRVGIMTDYLVTSGAGRSATDKEELETDVLDGELPDASASSRDAAASSSPNQRRIAINAAQKVFIVLGNLSITASMGDCLSEGAIAPTLADPTTLAVILGGAMAVQARARCSRLRVGNCAGCTRCLGVGSWPRLGDFNSWASQCICDSLLFWNSDLLSVTLKNVRLPCVFAASPPPDLPPFYR